MPTTTVDVGSLLTEDAERASIVVAIPTAADWFAITLALPPAPNL